MIVAKVHRLWPLAVRYQFAVSSAAGRSSEGMVETTFCLIFSLPLLCLEMQGVKGLAFALAKNVCLSVVLLLLVSVCCLWLNCFFLVA